MQRSIVEVEEHMERKMARHRERKIMEVHQHMDTFELHVLDWTYPSVDVSTLHAAVESLRADLDTILEARVPEYETSSTETYEDTILEVLLSTSAVPPPLPREHAKRRRGRLEN